MSYKSERSFERSMIPHEYIEELTRRTDIVELVGSYVQLKRKGRLYGGLLSLIHISEPTRPY